MKKSNNTKKVFYFLLLVVLSMIATPSLAQPTTCSSYAFKPTSNGDKLPTKNFKTCVDLPALDSYLHYNYYPTTSKLEIAYRHTGIDPGSPKWVAWCLNPVSHGMVGSQCLIAYQNPKDGSMVSYTSPITGYNTRLAEGPLSFNVSNLSAVSSNHEVTIFATLNLPKNLTVLNQVWQDGPVSEDGTLMMHSVSGPNVRSMASLNLLSGVASEAHGVNKGSLLKTVHGLLNAISWGFLMPLGVMIARYVKAFPSANQAWFYLHVGCQVIAFIMGVGGWATGLQLGSMSKGFVHTLHRNIGIALFSLAAIQMFSLVFRPKVDHKYRFYWTMYHRSIGYTVIILGIINIFEGFKILHPKQMWKLMYIAVIVALGCIAMLSEGVTWYMVRRRKKVESTVGDNKSGLP